MLKLKINKKDIEIVEEEYFVRGTVGAKCAITAVDEYWMSDEHLFDLIPFDPQIQESIGVEQTGVSVALVFKRNDMSSIKVYLIDYREDTNSLETFNAAFTENNKARGESEYEVYADIPYEVMANKGRFKVGFFMSLYYAYEDDEGNVVENVATTPTLWSDNVQVKNGTDTDGTTPTQYTPTELEQINSKITKKQDILTAGKNIVIDDNVISAKDVDLSNYATLKQKQEKGLLYLDDLSSQDTIELNLTVNNEISKNGTLMIIDGKNKIVNQRNMYKSDRQYMWGPSLYAHYNDGESEIITSSYLIGDSRIEYFSLADMGIAASAHLYVNLQDGVEYTVFWSTKSTKGDGDYSHLYYNSINYFFIIPTDSIKQKINYTNGTWGNIRRHLTGENALTGEPIYLFDEKSNIEIKYSPCSQYTAMKDYVDEVKEDMANSKEITDLKETLTNLGSSVSLLSTVVNAKTITTIGVIKDCKYTFDWNAMYFFKSNTGKTDITLLDSDGNNIIGSLKCSYGLLILPEQSFAMSQWTVEHEEGGMRKEAKLHGLFAGMTDKATIITTDKIQMLQFDLDPDKTVSVTPVAESVIVYKIKF